MRTITVPPPPQFKKRMPRKEKKLFKRFVADYGYREMRNVRIVFDMKFLRDMDREGQLSDAE